MARLIFTKEEMEIVHTAIMNTWQAIGCDVEQACAEGGERLTNESALECCIDAERILMYGGSKKKEAQDILNKKFADKSIKWTGVMNALKRKIRLA